MKEEIVMGRKTTGYTWGVRCGRALLELIGARQVVREMDRQEAKRRRQGSDSRGKRTK